ncbi:MAG: GMC family oxidoreductase N-terminal domain-containing protein, partial [Rubrivivax sp.]|nr:GMC family oxidoreductase N-terminal domain-containing protein [Rubrivivax sp.]
MSEGFDVIVVGSGAGGGVIASELALGGRRVLLLEAGRHLTSADFKRFEVKANHDLYWPMRFAPLPGGDVVAFLSGKSVGGSTTINTKVALRAHERDIAKWHPASGLTNDEGEPFSLADLEPFYDRVEKVLTVRERGDWGKSVFTAQAGFKALGTDVEPVMSYTDAKCLSYGSCLQGCPTDGGKSTMNTYIARALAEGGLDLRSGVQVQRILIEDKGHGPCATGVEYRAVDGSVQQAHARFVVAAAGAFNTSLLLLRSGLSNPAIGRHVGLHPLRLVYGLFDEIQ